MSTVRIGTKGWEQQALRGAKLTFLVNVHFDAESGTYWADSPDFEDLVAGGDTLDEVTSEMKSVAEALLELALDGKRPTAVAKINYPNTEAQLFAVA